MAKYARFTSFHLVGLRAAHKPTIIGPGDSGGAVLRQTANGWELVGINTLTEGYGGRFGDSGGGVLLAPYMDWISQTTGIPEQPDCAGLLAAAMAAMMVSRRARG